MLEGPSVLAPVASGMMPFDKPVITAFAGDVLLIWLPANEMFAPAVYPAYRFPEEKPRIVPEPGDLIDNTPVAARMLVLSGDATPSTPAAEVGTVAERTPPEGFVKVTVEVLTGLSKV
jgi:hypothetical protein